LTKAAGIPALAVEEADSVAGAQGKARNAVIPDAFLFCKLVALDEELNEKVRLSKGVS
jgi:hypothetical protein